MVSGKPVTTSETAGNDLSPSLHVKAMRSAQVSAEMWARVVIGKHLHIDRSDFASRQGGAKGAVPKGTAPGARPLGPKSTLLPSNEAALRGSPRWPAGQSPTGIPPGCPPCAAPQWRSHLCIGAYRSPHERMASRTTKKTPIQRATAAMGTRRAPSPGSPP